MSETKHTPLPWDLELDRSTFGHLHIKRAGEPGAKAWITYFYDWRSGEEVAMADAQLIVTSVNARPKVEELVQAAQLKRNVILPEEHPAFVGHWIAVPREDFDRLQEAIDALESALGGKAE